MQFQLNGRGVDIDAHPMRRLLDVLREECELTGTKEGCGEGECGACTVLVDGQAVVSCLVPFAQVEGRDVQTIEGAEAQALQRAFMDHVGAQCGICTPGMIMAAMSLGPDPTPKADAGSARRESVPVHGLRGDLSRHSRGEAGESHSGGSRHVVIERADVRTAVTPLTLRRPRSVREALTMLRDDGPLVAARGRDRSVRSRSTSGRCQPRASSISGRSSRSDASRCAATSSSLGALATYTSLTRSRLVKQRLPMLVDAARQVGGVQIQNRGTIGGNIANGSPAGDTLPVFAAAEAVVVVRSAGAERRIPFTEFYSGYRTSVLRPDELIVAVEIPADHGTPVVSEGRHACRTGHLEGRHGWRPLGRRRVSR